MEIQKKTVENLKTFFDCESYVDTEEIKCATINIFRGRLVYFFVRTINLVSRIL
jgi:hypothetical protein